MTLYRLNGSVPALLPAIFTPPDGYTRTHPDQWMPEELAEWGFVEAPEKPSYDPATQHEPVWDETGVVWRVDDLPPPVEAVVTYRPIDKVEAIALIRAVTGMTDAQELSFRDDTRLALFWRKWREDVGGTIHRGNPLTSAILDALQGTGYLNATQRDAVLTYWPKA